MNQLFGAENTNGFAKSIWRSQDGAIFYVSCLRFRNKKPPAYICVDSPECEAALRIGEAVIERLIQEKRV